MSEEKKETNAKDLAELTKGILDADLTKEGYGDLVKPGARQLGRTIETTTALVNALISPLRWVATKILAKEYNFERRIAERLNNVPQDQLQTPPLLIAGPTLQALQYAIEEPTLREMYEKLITTAMNKQTASSAHPAFVEIIKQLTPDEAKIFNFLATEMAFPTITISTPARVAHSVLRNPHQYVIKDFNIAAERANCGSLDFASTMSAIDNLIRLRLAYRLLEEREAVGNAEDYNQLKQHSTVQSTIKQLKEQNKGIQITHSGIEITEFGKQFYLACIAEHDRTSSDDSFSVV